MPIECSTHRKRRCTVIPLCSEVIKVVHKSRAVHGVARAGRPSVGQDAQELDDGRRGAVLESHRVHVPGVGVHDGVLQSGGGGEGRQDPRRKTWSRSSALPHRLVDVLARDGLGRPDDGPGRCVERRHARPRSAPAAVRQHRHDVAAREQGRACDRGQLEGRLANGWGRTGDAPVAAMFKPAGPTSWTTLVPVAVSMTATPATPPLSV